MKEHSKFKNYLAQNSMRGPLIAQFWDIKILDKAKKTEALWKAQAINTINIKEIRNFYRPISKPLRIKDDVQR